MSEEKHYRLEIDPNILKLLGPNLYTNIYYVLAELIANAYDASAKNVYIINNNDAIIVEDDGKGMGSAIRFSASSCVSVSLLYPQELSA